MLFKKWDDVYLWWLIKSYWKFARKHRAISQLMQLLVAILYLEIAGILAIIDMITMGLKNLVKTLL